MQPVDIPDLLLIEHIEVAQMAERVRVNMMAKVSNRAIDLRQLASDLGFAREAIHENDAGLPVGVLMDCLRHIQDADRKAAFYEEDIKVCICCRREWSTSESMAGCDPEGLTAHSWTWMKRGER